MTLSHSTGAQLGAGAGLGTTGYYILSCRTVHTALGLRPIVSYCASPIPHTCPIPIPVQCKCFIVHIARERDWILGQHNRRLWVSPSLTIVNISVEPIGSRPISFTCPGLFTVQCEKATRDFLMFLFSCSLRPR